LLKVPKDESMGVMKPTMMLFGLEALLECKEDGDDDGTSVGDDEGGDEGNTVGDDDGRSELAVGRSVESLSSGPLFFKINVTTK